MTVRQSTVLRQKHSSADEAGIRLHGNSAMAGSWNAILWPLLVLKGAEKFTLPIGLNTLLTPYGNNYDVLIAGSMFGILPILVIFLIFQKYIIEGMTAGAVKG